MSITIDLEICAPPDAANPPQPPCPPRARGRVRLSAKRRGAQSVIDGLHQAGSMRLMFPKPQGTALDAVIVNCAGGMTGGDQFETEATAGNGTTLSLTTQAAERIYRSPDRSRAKVTTRLHADAGATLHWLPQETILFDRSRLARRLEVTLAPDARFLMIEPLVFGRTAMGEVLSDAALNDQLRITREGVLIHADAARLEGPVEHILRGAAIASGGRAVASLVLACADACLQIDAARRIIGDLGGVSLKRDDLLVARLIAPDAMALRRVAIPLLSALSSTDIPRTWTL